MDQLPDSLLLQILSRLDDSADVARCRVASKAFDTLFPDLRSISLQCSLKWSRKSTPRVSNSSQIKPFKTIFLDLISKLKVVESVCIGHEKPFLGSVYGVDVDNDDHYLTDGDFAKDWLPRVSESLQSLSVSDIANRNTPHSSTILRIISFYCHKLVNLTMKFAWLSMQNLNPMPMLTSLTLEYTELEDEQLNEFNKCFPNLQVLNLVHVRGLKHPKIHLLNLKTCLWVVYKHRPSLTLITPSLTKLNIVCVMPAAIHVEAPVLSYFHLYLNGLLHSGAFTVKKFENLRTLLLECFDIGSLLLEFPITKTVENLTLDSRYKTPSAPHDSKFTLEKVFKVFPNVSALCIKSRAWSDLESCLNPEGWEILDGRKGLNTICAYLILVDPSLTFSCVACLLDQCAGLSEVSLLIHRDVVGTVFESFMSKCMAHWPVFKWRWGIWSDNMADSWITDGICN